MVSSLSHQTLNNYMVHAVVITIFGLYFIREACIFNSTWKRQLALAQSIGCSDLILCLEGSLD